MYISIKYIKSAILTVFLFVIYTNTYVVFAQLLHVSVGIITLVFFIVCLFFLLQRFGLLITLFKNPLGFSSLLFFILIPILVSFLNFRINISHFILVFFYYSILLFSYCYYEEIKRLNNILLLAIIFNLIAGICSIFFPDFFETYLKIVDSRALHFAGRAIGFFLQPNSFGAGMVMLYLTSIIILKEGFNKSFFLLCFACILITGSRSSLLIIFLVLFCQLISLWLANRHSLWSTIKSFLSLFSIISLIVITLFTVASSATESGPGLGEIVERVELYTEVIDNLDKIEKDGSMVSRKKKQSYFKKGISKNLIFGRGHGAHKSDLDSGLLKGSAHNMYLEILYQGGILYFFSYIFFIGIFSYFLFKYRDIVPDFYVAGSCIVIVVIVYSFFLDTLFDTRPFFICFGLVFRKLTSRDKFKSI